VAAAPERRLGQRALARALTSVVHGSDAIAAIEEAAAVLFGDQPITSASVRALDLLAAEVPSSTASRGDLLGSDPVDLVADEAVGLARSKGEVRRNLQGYSVNQVKLSERPGAPLVESDLLHGRYVLLARGRRTHHLVTVG